MEIIDNMNYLLGDDLTHSVHIGAKIRIAACYFSIYAYEALKAALEKNDSLQFIYTLSPMDSRKIEESKIECARRFFAKITSDQVKYDVGR